MASFWFGMSSEAHCGSQSGSVCPNTVWMIDRQSGRGRRASDSYALSLGMTLIDTSGNYGEGRSEELIKRVVVSQRDRAFVVSKVEANDATREAMALCL
jgi:aryl-alcohol dehydrogenase-like predicted oxidoreductase